MTEDLNKKLNEIRSEELDEILSRPPSWILHQGAVMFTFLICILISFSWFFHYPDIITAPIIITSDSPPISIVSRSSGKINALFVKENQKVHPGDYLAVLENSSDINSITSLKNLLNKINSKTKFETLPDSSLILTNLGELQEPYSKFTQSLLDYQQFKLLEFYRKKILAINEQIKLNRVYIKKQNDQKNLLVKNLKIGTNQFVRDSSLFVQKVITPLEYEKAEMQLINYKSLLKNSELAIATSMIQINLLHQQVLELQLAEKKENTQLYNQINNSYKILKSKFDAWEIMYVLKSTIIGYISIGNYWSTNQNVKSGDVVFSIIPFNKSVPIGKTILSMRNSGKVKIGQRVNIKLSNFPYNEYGSLPGKVNCLSLVPEQGKYYVEIELTNGLKTNYNKVLPFKQEMDGTAEIITDDIRLLERFFTPLRYLLNSNSVSK